jgi:hypothetical protein
MFMENQYTIMATLCGYSERDDKEIYEALDWSQQRFGNYFQTGRSLSPRYYAKVRKALGLSRNEFYSIIADYYD